MISSIFFVHFFNGPGANSRNLSLQTTFTVQEYERDVFPQYTPAIESRILMQATFVMELIGILPSYCLELKWYVWEDCGVTP